MRKKKLPKARYDQLSTRNGYWEEKQRNRTKPNTAIKVSMENSEKQRKPFELFDFFFLYEV